MDIRLKQLSYSSLLTLHSCPRKFQLAKLGSDAEDTDTTGSQNITFAFGHIVGEGVQGILEGKSEDTILWEAFLGWHADLWDENAKQNKSFWLAMLAIQKFQHIAESGFLEEYELVYYEGKPAVELSFCINFPDGFRYRGFVDAVLRHKRTGKIVVLECKTSSANVLNPAEYKNSAQAIGYSVVLDVLFPGLSAYEVVYMVYRTKEMEWEPPIPFQKSYLQRALWIQELLLDIESIKLYEGAEIYPMHGESCFSWYRECEYMNLCTLSTSHLTKPLTEEAEQKILAEPYTINLSIQDLIQAQLAKAEG